MMDYYHTDLAKVIDNKKINLNEEDIKAVMSQLVKGVYSLHNNYILHRDIKPANVLVDFEGNCVLTDFGLSRKFAAPDMKLTKNVITRWYRPPEVLFGAQYYSDKVDVWSLGCIFAEFFYKQPLCKGDNDIDQLSKIFRVLFQVHALMINTAVANRLADAGVGSAAADVSGHGIVNILVGWFGVNG